MSRIIVGISGASGAVYGQRLLHHLSELAHQWERVGVLMSENAITNWELEIGPFQQSSYPFDFYHSRDFNPPFASGSALYTTMIICPCSMGVLGRIAHGVSNDLMTRAADVIIKERRSLILVPRETPLSLIHINNMKIITEAGGIICPASPSFYSDPQTKTELVDTVVHRVLDLAGLKLDAYRWHS